MDRWHGEKFQSPKWRFIASVRSSATSRDARGRVHGLANVFIGARTADS
jgi:hypothetical protein